MADSGKKAVVLLSGGLDSATAAAAAREAGFELHALTVDYGQRHRIETQSAQRVAAALGIASHRFTTLDLRAWGGSALTGDAPVPKHRSAEALADGIPVTYVPARNTVLLALALACAEAVGAEAIFIGVSAVDYSGYPDCRPAFVEAFRELAAVATQAGVEGRPIAIEAPLLHLSKAETIQLGLRLGVDYGLTHSCYDPTPAGLACGACDSCQLRRQGFVEAGVPDPTHYADAGNSAC